MAQTGYDPSEIYVTSIEQEAYDLGGQLALGQCRSHVSPRYTNAHEPYWVVICDAPEAYDRARKIRKQMLGS